MKKKSLLFLFFSFVFLINSASCISSPIRKEPIQTLGSKENLPFQIGKKVSYGVKFNGINVGKINLEYLGRDIFDKESWDVIQFSSNVKILAIFEIESQEKIHLDINTYLPSRVERDVKFLGREESILEEYNQKEGWVRVTNTRAKFTEQRLIQRAPPIHNSIILFFLHPIDLKGNNIGKTFEFNLPLQKISVKIKELRKIAATKGVEEFYLLEGSPRKFLIWIKKGQRLPVRLELPAFLGKVVILKI